MLGTDLVLLWAAIIVQACLVGILLRKWLQAHNNPKAVLIIFFTTSCLLLTMTAFEVATIEHAKIGVLGPAAAFIAVSSLFDPRIKKWSVTAYAIVTIVVLLIPFSWTLRVIAVFLSIGSLIISGWAYVTTRNKGMLYFTLGIALFTVAGLTASLELLPHQVNMVGIIIGVLMWSLPFVRGS